MNAGVQQMKANLAQICDMLMSTDLFHSQNACVHCLAELIRFNCIRCQQQSFFLF